MEVGNAASVLGRIEGDVENGVLPAGQGAGTIAAVEDAGAVVEQVMRDAKAILSQWGAG